MSAPQFSPSSGVIGKSTAGGAAKLETSQPKLKRLAIYAFYDPSGGVADYVVYKLQQLRQHVDTLVVVCNGSVDAEGQARLAKVSDGVHLRENSGFDIWGFRQGLVEVVGWEKLAAFDEVVLLNSTFYGPIFPFSEMFGEMDQRKTDFWGITAFKGPVPNGFTGVGMLPFHIQSYFMAFRRRLFSTNAFQDYWENLPVLATYVEAVLIHETRFTEYLSKQGFRYSLYCDPEKYGAINPSFDMLDVLLENRCPILKRRAFFHEPVYLDLNNVELSRALSLIKSSSDYDCALIWKDITKVAKPHDLYTNATLLEIPAAGGAPAELRSDLKIAALVHVTSTGAFEEVLRYLRNIPVAFDLHITTSDGAKKKEIEKVLAAEALPCPANVKIVDPRGSDVAALVVGQRDLMLSNRYDYVCRLHTSPSSGMEFPRSRHFKQHHLENLLSNAAYVSHLLAIFERDPSIGMILPPAVHIAHSSARNVHAVGAREWAKKLGITAPLDTYTPEVPTGSMFWCRPAALGSLFNYEFQSVDFEAKSEIRIDALETVLQRLLLPAVHQSCHYAKFVLTPANLAKNYVKLEYKLQQTIGGVERPRPPPPAHFPKAEVKDFVRDQLKSSATALGVAQASFRATRLVYRFARQVAERINVRSKSHR